MRIFTVAFGDEYLWMLDAMRRSVIENFPDAQFVVAHVKGPPPSKWLQPFLTNNDLKMEYWAQYIEEAPEGAHVVLMDCDTLVLRPLDAVFESQFDIAYTVRDGKVPFNSGVVFIKVSDKTRKFMRQWADANHAMIKKGSTVLHLVAEFAGINQRTMRDMLDRYSRNGTDFRIKAVPCAIWNCEQENYKNFDPDKTAVLHVKSWLREMLMGAPQTLGSDAERALLPICRRYGYGCK